ncbi:MAG TPA: MlaD family protein [Thermoleophilaceae bacterium]|nr:MlaD family protein [Thermoleophilaceae bacterium]
MTVLVTLVAVFLAYNANNGLPFVPTYNLKAELPSGANLVKNNDVRIGGERVGAVTDIQPVRHSDGSVSAVISMKLEKRVYPLPRDSTLIVRPRSALGLKYVEITPGQSQSGYAAGATIPLAQAKPEPVEIDEFLSMFDEPTRTGSQEGLKGFGDGLTGRGNDLNEAIVAFRPLLTDLQPVAENLSSRDTQLKRFFPALERAATEVAPVSQDQADLFVNLDTTFTALAGVAPFIQETISKGPPTLDTVTAELPKQRPFIRNLTAFMAELRPGVATLPKAAPQLGDAFAAGAKNLPRTVAMNKQLEDVFRAVQRFSTDPLVPKGLERLTHTVQSLKPTLDFVTPAQTTCNYVTLYLRNVADLLSVGDANGTWQRFIQVITPPGPNNEGFPSSAPANGGGTKPSANHLHSNPYPNTAAPGQEKECEAGNEPYTVGQTVIGSPAGNQGTRTAGQVKGQG